MSIRGGVPKEITGMGAGRRNYEACHLHDDVIGFDALHSHDFYEIYLNVRGGRQYVLDDQTFTLTGNDLILVLPFQIHGHLGADPLYDYERMFIYITREVVEELSHNILPINRLLEQAGREHRFFCHVTNEQAAQAARYIDAIRDNCRRDTPYTRLGDVALLTQMLLWVLERVESKPPEEAPHEEKPPLIRQVLNYINDHFDQRLTLDDIAGRFYISKSYLSHIFTEHTSRSLYDYILYCRINRAKQLITDGTALTDISYQCGFSDYSNFLRTFARYVGCPPSGYRKRLQAGAGLAPIREGAPGDAEGRRAAL